MDEETRVAAEDKLDAMSVFVAYSDELLDDGKIDEYYENLEIEGDDYLSSSFNVSRFYLQRYFEGLRKPTDDWTSQGNSAVVNAFYNRRRNLIGNEISNCSCSVFNTFECTQYCQLEFYSVNFSTRRGRTT